MDQTSRATVMKRCICIFASLLVLSMAGDCGAADKPAGELELELQEAFRTIYFSNFGRDYPGSARLATCTPEKDELCYKTSPVRAAFWLESGAANGSTFLFPFLRYLQFLL